VAGYSLFMPVGHSNSFASLSPDALKAAAVRLEGIRTTIAEEFGPTIIAEHGASECSRGASCCDHAHIHLVPCRPDKVALAYAEATDSAPATLATLADLSQFHGSPYMLLSPLPRVYWVWGADHFPSQFVRMVCADVLGIPELYDWRSYQFTENMRITERRLKLALSRLALQPSVA
jgi:diadenosine tetraphosphate (Ap4A) HIT family hydrolase